jgi:hypothetical protein
MGGLTTNHSVAFVPEPILIDRLALFEVTSACWASHALPITKSGFELLSEMKERGERQKGRGDPGKLPKSHGLLWLWRLLCPYYGALGKLLILIGDAEHSAPRLWVGN